MAGLAQAFRGVSALARNVATTYIAIVSQDVAVVFCCHADFCIFVVELRVEVGVGGDIMANGGT